MGVCNLARQPRCSKVEFADQALHAVIGHGRRVRIEGVRFDDFGTDIEKSLMDFADNVRPCDRQHVIVAFQIAMPVGEAITPIILF